MNPEERLRAAFAEAQNFFMSTDDDLRLKGALAAVILSYPEDAPERDLLKRSVGALQQMAAMLSALQNGIPVDIEAMPLPDPDILPLVKWWNEAKDKAKGE
jgi:hypothetical protein